MNLQMELHVDAFSSGQISSKLWLCEELEAAVLADRIKHPICWILGGWYGLTSFLLFSRGRCNLRHVRSFDRDPSCLEVADRLNENWVWQNWKFKAFTADCNNLPYTDGAYGLSPQIVINTSIEHFERREWWERIPQDTLVVLQCCDMIHADHHHTLQNLEQLIESFPLTRTHYFGQRQFKYPSWNFTRFMLIGRK